MSKKQFRELVVRAIEDAAILFMLFVGVWAIAAVMQVAINLLMG